ncbi:MAG: VWA domain-containing protein [Phycisphaerales bacterium]|nr:VWA domain-containing protein [Phycisphaerales bacterium]
MAALIAAAIAFPVLAIFYLLKLRRRPVRISSTLLWQQAYEDLEANIPWRWVRPSWLVLLHALLVALVVLAIGRPAIHAHGPVASRMVFIIDRSASMSALDGDPRITESDDGLPITRLREAQARARSIIDDSMRMGRRIEAAVISIAAEAQGLTSMTSDRRLLQETIAGITPTDQPLDLQQALRLAEAILGKRDTTGSEPADPEAAPLVIFLSDGSLPAGEPLSISGAALRLERVGPPPDLALTGPDSQPDVQPAGRDNVGITTLSARRDEANPAVVRVFVQIASALRRARDLPITVSLAGIERQRRAIEVPAATAESPGIQATTFEIQTRDAGVLTVALIADDLLASDNQASLLLDAPRSPEILLVVPDESPTEQAATVEEPLTPAWLLESILTELRPSRLQIAKASEADGLIRAAAGAFDLIVLDRTAPPILPAVPTLSLGAGLPSIGITISPATAGAPDRDFILSWERSHPILRDVSLDTVFALAPASIQFAPIDPANTGELQRTDLALGASGPMISLLDVGGVRHIVLAFDLGRSNWGLQVGFPIFLVNALDYLTLRGSQQSAAALRTADPIELAAPANLATIVLEGPTRREIRLPDTASTASAERTVSIGRLERAGIYTAQPSRVRPVMIPVSLLDPLESALGVSEQINIRSRGSAGDDRAAPSLPREIGDYLLLAALGLLIVEWIVYTRSARV